MTPYRSFRRTMMLKATLMSACLFAAAGCPQIFGNSLKTGFRSFVEVSLPALLLTAIDVDALLESIMANPPPVNRPRP